MLNKIWEFFKKHWKAIVAILIVIFIVVFIFTPMAMRFKYDTLSAIQTLIQNTKNQIRKLDAKIDNIEKAREKLKKEYDKKIKNNQAKKEQLEKEYKEKLNAIEKMSDADVINWLNSYNN